MSVESKERTVAVVHGGGDGNLTRETRALRARQFTSSQDWNDNSVNCSFVGTTPPPFLLTPIYVIEL